MPKVTIWVREKDYQAFLKIKNRPAFISWAIEKAKKQLEKQQVKDIKEYDVMR